MAQEKLITLENLSTFKDNLDNEFIKQEVDPTVPSWAKAATKPQYTASEVGLGKVGNFKAVSTESNQGLTETEKTNARQNIGASNLTLGETSTTAYRGDRGKTAYDHATETRLTTATSSGLYKVASTKEGHIASLTAVAKSDITGLGIPAQDTTYDDATQSEHGLMSVDDKKKLDGIAPNAEVNQNAFSNVKVGTTTVAADSKTDTLELAAGSNITLTPDATNDKVTIAAKDTTYTIASGDSNGQIKVTPSSGDAYNVSVKGLGSAAYKAITDSYSSSGTDAVSGKAVAAALGTLDVASVGGSGKYITTISETNGKISASAGTADTAVTKDSSNLVTSGAVWTAIDSIPEPMVFKGSLGTDGTITALPVDGSAKVGDTYKVITAGIYASQAAKVGDTFICDSKTSTANTWNLIPSGDEPSGTVTSVKIEATSPIVVSSTSAITTSGTRTISLAASGVTAGSAGPTAAVTGSEGTTVDIPRFTVDTYGRVTALSSYKLTNKNTTYGAATTSANGLMSSGDKTKMDGMAMATFGTCETAAATAAKIVTLSNTNWQLKVGSIIAVKFSVSNTASNVTLNVNGTGAKSIYYNNAAYTGSSTTVCGYKDRTHFYVYDGTYWVWVSAGGDTGVKVTQTNTTGNADYRVLFSANANDTSETTTARKNADFLYNPSTGTVTVKKLQNGGDIHADGNYSHAEGQYTYANGQASHAEGNTTFANGDNSHAEGYDTQAGGEYSHAEGGSTITSGSYSHAEGYYTSVAGSYSHAEGYDTTTYGTGSHTEGNITYANGNYSHAEGYKTTASGDYSHAEGYNNEAQGDSSHAEGILARANGDYSHAEGGNSSATASTVSFGAGSHAEGEGTSTHGICSHAEGYLAVTNGHYSHAEGCMTSTIGQYSHAEGQMTYAVADYSHASGIGTCATAQGQTVIGKYNIADADYAFIIGGGTSSVKSNLFGIKWDGTMVLNGSTVGIAENTSF